MQRTGQRHDEDGERHGKADGNGRVRDEGRDRDADKRRNRIATDDRPRLGQRAGGHGEEQDGGRADGRDDQGKMCALPHDETADQAGEANADEGAEAADQPFLEGGAGEDGGEQPELGEHARFAGIVRR